MMGEMAGLQGLERVAAEMRRRLEAVERALGFAATLGIHRVYLYQMLGGFSRPSLSLAARIERATGGSVPAASWVAPPDEAAA